MKKYSRATAHQTESNFSARNSSKSSFKQSKGCELFKMNYTNESLRKSKPTKSLKVKKADGHYTLDKDIGIHASIDSIPGIKKHAMQLSKKIKSKTREFVNTIGDPVNDSKGDNVHTVNLSKTPGSQLVHYTNKSKRLAGSNEKTNTSKNSSKSKKRLNNSISCNMIRFEDNYPQYPKERKMSKYVPAKTGAKQMDTINKTDEFCNTRRVNSSMSNLSSNNRMDSSKSKSKKKKKKPTHMKSYSNIPPYQDHHISSKNSTKKQYSDSKAKKKKSVKHAHHQSEANVSTSITNKNNILMIDSAIGMT